MDPAPDVTGPKDSLVQAAAEMRMIALASDWDKSERRIVASCWVPAGRSSRQQRAQDYVLGVNLS
jgi:hypothetical protein